TGVQTCALPILIFGMGYLGAKTKPKLNVAVVDSSGYFDRGRIERENQKDSSSLLTLLTVSPDSLQKSFSELGYDAYIVIPKQDDWEKGLKNLLMFTNRTKGAETSDRVESKLNNIWSEIKNDKLRIDDEKRTILNTSTVNLRAINIHDTSA